MSPQDESSEESSEKQIPDASDAEKRSFLVWLLVRKKLRQGEDLKTVLLWAIRNGGRLPDDLKSRAWFADALEGKLDPERGRGRPRKKQRGDIVPTAVERGIAKAYQIWLDFFERDRELAWLKAEGQRLRQEHPEAAVWRRRNDLHMEEARQSFKAAITALGARPCPPAARGAETARELALKATAQERGEAWKSRTGKHLTHDVVARIVTSTRKAIEEAIAKAFHRWLDFFERDREVAWLRFEALRLREETPDAAVADLGARPCPPAAQATPRELAQEATAQERGAVWEGVTGKRLTPALVARLTRAKKSK